MRFLVVPAFLPLLAACSPETKPTARLVCNVADAPSLSVNFGIGSGGNVGHTRRLDYGDGQTSDGKAELDVASHTYAAPGRYTVRLTVRADNGSATDECLLTVPKEQGK